MLSLAFCPPNARSKSPFAVTIYMFACESADKETDPTNPAGSGRKHLGHFSTPARSELGSTRETVRTRTRAGRCRQSDGGTITLYRRTGVSLLTNWLRALLCHSASELPESNSSLQSSLTSQFRLIVEVHHGLCYTPPQPALNS